MDYIWCLCKAKEPNIHLEAILYTFGGNFGSFQSQKSFGANLPPPVSQRKLQSLFQIGLRWADFHIKGPFSIKLEYLNFPALFETLLSVSPDGELRKLNILVYQ